VKVMLHLMLEPGDAADSVRLHMADGSTVDLTPSAAQVILEPVQFQPADSSGKSDDSGKSDT
jgi:hypothetical protein